MNKKVKKGIDIGAIILVCIIFLLGACLLTLSVTRKKDNIPRLFGLTFLDIQTESMSPTIKPADIVILKSVKNASDIKVDDVVTFWDWIDFNENNIYEKNERVLNTHRVIEIVQGASQPMFKTRGDNNAMPDEKLRSFDDIEGVQIGRLPKFGHFTRFLANPWGFFLIFVLPLSAFLVYRVIILIRVILDMRKEKLKEVTGDTDALKAELEALRAKVAVMESGEKPPEAVTQVTTNTDTKDK